MHAYVAQLVERILGKDEVIGSIPIVGSILSFEKAGNCVFAQSQLEGVRNSRSVIFVIFIYPQQKLSLENRLVQARRNPKTEKEPNHG